MLAVILDWVPLICFFIAFKIHGIYFATKVLIVASLCQLAINKFLLNKNIEPINWAIFALILVTGGLTLFFHNESFIKWKPTILYIAFAIAFLATPSIKKAGLAEIMLASKIELPPIAWKKLNHGFILFFVFMAALNTYVFMQFSTETWVNYKLFGTLAMTTLFMLAVSYYIIKNKAN